MEYKCVKIKSMDKVRKNYHLFWDTVKKIEKIARRWAKQSKQSSFSLVVTEAVDLLYDKEFKN